MTIIDQIVQSPRMPQYVRRLVDILEAERAKRQEFYEWLPDDKKAEFINGSVIVHSPVRIEHNGASLNLAILLKTYVTKHQLGYVGHEKLLVCLTRNDYEPDVCFWGNAKSSGFKDGQMQFPAPDLAIEVLSPTTTDYDRTIKFEDYAAHGVDEYWIVEPQQKTIEQYLLTAGVFQLALKKNDGALRSRAISGLEIPVAAAFDADANLRALAAIMNG